MTRVLITGVRGKTGAPLAELLVARPGVKVLGGSSDPSSVAIAGVAPTRFSWDDPSTWTGAIDRCPCGTGTCAKMAVLHAKGELPLDRDFRHQGILGTVYTGRLVEETRIGDRVAVVPTISGRAWISGFSTLVLDPEDPLPEGYRLGDIWA